MQITKDDMLLVVRNLPSHHNLIRVFRGDEFSVVCDVLLIVKLGRAERDGLAEIGAGPKVH
jgi:hypothetical protein